MGGRPTLNQGMDHASHEEGRDMSVCPDQSSSPLHESSAPMTSLPEEIALFSLKYFIRLPPRPFLMFFTILQGPAHVSHSLGRLPQVA